jgi:acyl carrier protein
MASVTVEEVQRAVTAFIVENFLFGNAAKAPSPEASFLETGLVDSTGVLEIITFIEGKYEISVSEDEMIPQNLDSVANLGAFVLRKKGA